MLNSSILSLAVGLVALELVLLLWLWRGQRKIRSVLNDVLTLVVSVASFAVLTTLLLFFWQAQGALLEQAGETRAQLAASHRRRLVLEVQREVASLRTLAEDPAFVQVAQASTAEWGAWDVEMRADQLAQREAQWQTQAQSYDLRQTVLFNAASHALDDFTRDFPAYRQVWLVNAHGALVAGSTRALPERYDHTGTAWWPLFAAAEAPIEDVYMGPVVASPEQPELLLEMALPLYHPHSTILYGVLVAQWDARYLETFADFSFLGDTGDLHWVDGRGMTVHSTTPAYVGEPLPTAVRAAIRGHEPGWQIVADADGRERLYAYAPLAEAEAGLYLEDFTGALVVEQDPRELLQAAAPLSRFVLGGGLAALVAIVAVSVLMAYRFTGPIWSLAETALAIQQGDWERQAPETGPREFQILARALNRLTEQIRAGHPPEEM